MTGRDFLPIARELLRGKTEPHRRAAAGRAYYALLLEARDNLARWGFAPPGFHQTHIFVRLRYTYCADRAVKDFGYALEDLNKLRNRADYELTALDFRLDKPVQDAIKQAEDGIAFLDALNADPARVAAVVADIRARWP